MTSSWALTKRKQMMDPDGNKTWSISKFSSQDDGMGGWSNHYITPGHTHECAPGYKNTPIGNPYGFGMCVKMDQPTPTIDPSVFNGYNRYQTDLYDPTNEVPRQVSNPYGFYERRIPNESFLRQRDYISREIKYDGIGTKLWRTPGPVKYKEYGFGFDKEPPYKYDIQQLHQKYPLWKEEQIYTGRATQEEMDEFDKTYNNINGMAVW